MVPSPSIRTARFPLRLRLPAVAVEWGGLLTICWLMWMVWRATALPVTVTVDGVSERVTTHRRSVSALLLDLGVDVQSADRVWPALDANLRRGMALAVDRAPAYRLLVDGRDFAFASWGQTPYQVLTNAQIAIHRYDQALVNGEPWPMHEPLPEPTSPDTTGATSLAAPYGHDWHAARTQSRHIRVYRAIPIRVNDGRLPFTIHTTAQTVGEALRQAQITLYLGDEVEPSLGSPVNTGMTVFIDRSIPVSLQVDERRVKTRTRGETVADALIEMGIGLSGLDVVQPSPTAELHDDMHITVTRIRQDVEVTDEIVPFETVFVPDAELPIDTRRVVNPGDGGIIRQRERVRYEDGAETVRVLEDEWTAQEPDRRVIAYGTQIEPKTTVTADGEEITYWRRIRMQATSYSASTAGLPPDHPWYGRTYSGEPMRHGVVAVDPAVIPLRSRVYVPGYGYGDALDTGSAIRARRIDLGYDDDNLELWSSWVNVYLLWPPPPTNQITWVLPNWPPPPQ